MVQEKAFRIKLNTDTKSLVSGLRKGGAGAAGLGGLAGGPLIAGIGLIVSQLKVFQPVVSMVKAIVNIIGEFLRPVSDVIILLLMPILQILKPILIIVRQIMQPFRQAAFKFMNEAGKAFREGDTAKGAALTALSLAEIGLGVEAVGLFFTKEILKTMIDSFAGLFGPLLSFFGINVDDAVKVAKDSIDLAASTLIATSGARIAMIGAMLGVDISREFTSQIAMLRVLFITGDNSFISVFDSLTSGFESSLGSLIGVFRSKLDELNSLSNDIDLVREQSVPPEFGGVASSNQGTLVRRSRNMIFVGGG